mgnify:CR=1 FL=1
MQLPRILALIACLAAAPIADGDEPMISIAIHGGAGVINRASMSDEAERAYRADLGRALDAKRLAAGRAQALAGRKRARRMLEPDAEKIRLRLEAGRLCRRIAQLETEQLAGHVVDRARAAPLLVKGEDDKYQAEVMRLAPAEKAGGRGKPASTD